MMGISEPEKAVEPVDLNSWNLMSSFPGLMADFFFVPHPRRRDRMNGVVRRQDWAFVRHGSRKALGAIREARSFRLGYMTRPLAVLWVPPLFCHRRQPHGMNFHELWSGVGVTTGKCPLCKCVESCMEGPEFPMTDRMRSWTWDCPCRDLTFPDVLGWVFFRHLVSSSDVHL